MTSLGFNVDLCGLNWSYSQDFFCLCLSFRGGIVERTQESVRKTLMQCCIALTWNCPTPFPHLSAHSNHRRGCCYNPGPSLEGGDICVLPWLQIEKPNVWAVILLPRLSAHLIHGAPLRASPASQTLFFLLVQARNLMEKSAERSINFHRADSPPAQWKADEFLKEESIPMVPPACGLLSTASPLSLTAQLCALQLLWRLRSAQRSIATYAFLDSGDWHRCCGLRCALKTADCRMLNDLFRLFRTKLL